MSKAFKIEGQPSTAAISTYTAIEFLLDETGSMSSARNATISGFNEYVNSQRNQPGDCVLTLTKFDSTGVRTQYTDTVVSAVELLTTETYKPNAMTNLYDAIGTRINALATRAVTYPADSAILFVIMTDGEDNQSTEYTADSVKKLIQEKEKLGWTFVFLGANQDAWKVGQAFGMAKGNTMTYDTANMAATMTNLSGATTAYRSIRAQGLVANASASSDFFADVKVTADLKKGI